MGSDGKCAGGHSARERLDPEVLTRTIDAVARASVTAIVGPPPIVAELASALARALRTPDSDLVTVVDATTWDATGASVSGRTILCGPHPAAEALVVVDERYAVATFVRAASQDGRSGGIFHDMVPRNATRVTTPFEIAILGPTEFRGLDTPIRNRPLLTELVVYLALHRDGALSRSLTHALWPDREVPVQTFSNRLCEARQMLGFAPDDRPRLRREGDRHRIIDCVTDWDRFKTLARNEDDPNAWRAALALVRGRPFVDLAQGQWAELEGFAGEIERGVVECGLALGRRLLATGDPDGAAWAAQMALRAAPWNEQLHRLLMKAADAVGDRAGVDAALRHLALVLDVDGDPLGVVHPQTAALYARLAPRSDSARANALPSSR